MTPETNLTRLGVLISGGGRTLLNIQQHIRVGWLPARIVRVIASRPCKGIEICRQAGFDVHLASRKEMPDTTAFSARVAELLDDAEVDLVLLAGFLSFWEIPPRYANRVMNIHPALLPAFGGHGMYGHRVHEAVLAAGCKVSGCTVHFCDRQYDTGPIIVQRCVSVEEGDTPDTLAARVFQQECIAYPEAINLFAAGRLRIDGRVVHILPR